MQQYARTKNFRYCTRLGLLNAKMNTLPLFYLFGVISIFLLIFGPDNSYYLSTFYHIWRATCKLLNDLGISPLSILHFFCITLEFFAFNLLAKPVGLNVN